MNTDIFTLINGFIPKIKTDSNKNLLMFPLHIAFQSGKCVNEILIDFCLIP